MTRLAEPTLQRARPVDTYQNTIRRILAAGGRRDIDPRHVEAWMRNEHRTLDHLSVWQFADEVDLALRLIAASGTKESERLARSYGL